MVNDPRDFRDTAQTIINRKTSGLIEAYRTTPDVHTIFRSIKKLTTQTSHEYGNRFLFELIQNAFDAHPEAKRNGIIHIQLARDEGDHGVLYVANKGRPFDESNFDAICQLAQSSKVPGEGIGNKGIGFRSVLQICKWPEVYSAISGQDGSNGFQGFCFGFARPETLRSIVKDNELYLKIIKDVSPYALPIVLTQENETVNQFAQQGFATVVRLPLKSNDAMEGVVQQLDLLRNAKAPVMLFLDRLSTLVIEDKMGGYSSRIELSRKSELPFLAQADAQVIYELVNLGSNGTYFLAKWFVDEDRLRKSIAESVQAELLPVEWAEWKGTATVSVAVRTDSEEDAQQCLYNFLPMSRARSPFHGYLNAPFYAKTDRTDLHEDVPLNTFFIDIAAALCVRAIYYLKRLSLDYVSSAVLDLLTWSSKEQERLERAFEDKGENVYEADVIPILRGKKGKQWSKLDTVYNWFGDHFRYLNAKILANSTEAELLDPKIGQERASRLNAFCAKEYSVGLTPPPDEIAGWIEEVAKHLHRTPFNAKRWDSFYEDVAKLFSAHEKVLIGRKILIGADHQLHPCGQQGGGNQLARSSVFFPPVRTRADGDDVLEPDADIQIPGSLARYISYLHPELTWIESEGRVRKRKNSRTFFEDKGLVKAYETRDLLENIGLLLTKTKSDRVRADALKWIHGIQQAVNYNQPLDQLNLYVPTTSGWLPASDALFSEKWPASSGPLLAKLISETRTVSPELSEMERRFVLAPEQWPFKLADVDSWASFLKKVGVRDGLWPKNLCDVEEVHDGFYLRPQNLNFITKIDSEELNCWVNEVNANARFPYHPNTPYRIKGTVWRVPGQLDHSKFPESARRSYAQLVITNMSQWPASVWKFVVNRPNHPNKPDQMKWPTPLLAVLKQTPWLPMSRPGDRDKWDFQPPPSTCTFQS